MVDTSGLRPDKQFRRSTTARHRSATPLSRGYRSGVVSHSRSKSFRTHPGASAAWVAGYAVLCTALALGLGLVDFLDSWKAVVFGAWIGLCQAAFHWWMFRVVVSDGELVSRHWGWVEHVPIEDIELVRRVRYRRRSGVAVKLRTGEEIMLSAPVSSVFAPNPDFDEELNRLCATLALGEGERYTDDSW